MIFETKNLYVKLSETDDIKAITDIYNTNLNFLKVHLNKKDISIKWIKKEREKMEKLGFLSCVICKKETNEIIGVLDFKKGEKAIISLLMIGKREKNRGLGMESYKGLELYLKKAGTKSIRLEVVNNYSEEVIEFWKNRGFREKGEINIQWDDLILKATSFEKLLTFRSTDFDELYEIAKEKAIGKELSKNVYVGSVAAVIVSGSGKIYTGVSLEANCALGFCAETGAIAKMISNGEGRIEKLVAVHNSGKIYPPCGRCRELIMQLHEENCKCEILLEDDEIKTLEELLPYKVY